MTNEFRQSADAAASPSEGSLPPPGASPLDHPPLEGAVDKVLARSADEAPREMGDLLDDMEEINRQKRAMLQYVDEINRQELAMRASLRDGYDDRDGLPGGEDTLEDPPKAGGVLSRKAIPPAEVPEGVMESKLHVYRTVLLFVSSIVVVVLLIGIALVGGQQLLNSAPGSLATPDSTTVVVAVSPSGGLATASSSAAPIDSQPGFTRGPSPSATAPVASAVPVHTDPMTPPTSTPKPIATPTPTPTATPVPTKPPVVVFTATPKAAGDNCKTGLKAFSLLLDNTGSNVSVSWSVNFSASDYAGDWGAAKPASGVVPAGESALVTVTPQDLCPVSKTVTDYFLKVLYAGPSPVTVTYTVTP